MDHPKSKMNTFIAKKLGFPIFNRNLIKGSKGAWSKVNESKPKRIEYFHDNS